VGDEVVWAFAIMLAKSSIGISGRHDFVKYRRGWNRKPGIMDFLGW
jgi:hypothetical protein